MATTVSNTTNARSQAQRARRERERMEQEQKTENPQATRDDIWAAALWVAENTNRIPTLVGPTAVGKTYGVYELAKGMNAEVVSVLLSQHTPDEVMGFQMPGKDNRLVEQLPFWARRVQNILADNRKVIILFDELNLAREEVRGAVYTFLRDRTIHGHDFNNPNVLVFAAMNPGVLGAAYLSRCCLFHVPADRNYLLRVAGESEMARIAANTGRIALEGEDTAYSNEAPPAPLTVEASALAALKAAEASTSFWNMTPAARGLVISSLVPPEIASEVAGGLKFNLNGADLINDPELIFETIRALPVPEAMNVISSILACYPTADKKASAAAHAKLHEAIYAPHDVDPELILAETYFFNAPAGMRDNLQHLDAEELVKAFAATGWVTTKTDGTPTGRLYERLEQAVKYNEQNPEK